MNIAKELLSEVLKRKIKFVNPRINDNEVSFIEEDNDRSSINIYELQARMKEWAYNKGYILASNINAEIGVCEVINIGNIKGNTYIEHDTEFEAVVQACEYILSIKDKRCSIN